MDPEAQEEHQSQRREDNDPAEGAGVDELAESGQLSVGHCEVEGTPGRKAGNSEAKRHQVVDPDHVGAQALVDGGVRAGARRCDARLIVAKVSHVFLLLLLPRRVSAARNITGGQAPLAGLQHAYRQI